MCRFRAQLRATAANTLRIFRKRRICKSPTARRAGKIAARHFARRNEAYQFLTRFLKKGKNVLRLRGAWRLTLH
jgi:hypothetical protein